MADLYTIETMNGTKRTVQAPEGSELSCVRNAQGDGFIVEVRASADPMNGPRLIASFSSISAVYHADVTVTRKSAPRTP